MIRQLGPTIDEIRTQGEGDSESWLPQKGLDVHLQQINEKIVEKLEQQTIDRIAAGEARPTPSRRQMEAMESTKDINKWLPHNSYLPVTGKQQS